MRVSSLGDVIHNMPMVQDILRHWPDAHIDWVVEEAYVDLVGMTRGVANIIPVALRRWRKQIWQRTTRAEISAFRVRLKAQAYDYVFDTQGLLKTGLLMSWSRLAPNGKRVGLANATEGSGYEGISRLFHDQSVPVARRCHAVARGRDVAAAALGYACDGPADFGLAQVQFTDAPAWLPGRAYAVFFHGTARAAKQWSLAAWVEVGQFLSKQGWVILLPWGSDAEQQVAQQLASQIPAARVLPRLPLPQAMQLAHGAGLVLGVDTGLTHAAAAFERPTVEIYCDSPRWKTECNWSARVINLGDTGQPPSAAEVLAAIHQLGCDAPPV